MNWKVDENKPWFKKKWPNNCPKNIQFNEISCGEFFENQRAKHYNSIFMSFLNTNMSYGEAGNYIDAIATSLYRLGLEKGGSLALLMPNCFQYVLSFYACMKIGVIVVPINPKLEKDQIIKILKITGPTTIITDNISWKNLLRPLMPRINIEFLIYTDILDFVKNKKNAQRRYGKMPHPLVDFPNAIRLVDLANSLIQLPKVPIDPRRDIAVYVSTAGSTGDPKLCTLTHFNLISNAKQCSAWLGIEGSGFGNLGIIGLYNPFGITCIMNTTIAIGGYIKFFPKEFSDERLLLEIQEIDASVSLILFAPELIFRKILEGKSRNDFLDISGKIKHAILIASSGSYPFKKEFLKSMNLGLVESYGLTEASPIISIGKFFIEEHEIHLGLPLPGTEWGIFNPNNFDEEFTEKFGKENIGEICISGPQVMNGYLGDQEATQIVLKKRNNKIWLCTGDLGFMNEDGTITLTSRKLKKLEKVERVPSYLVDIEQFLLKLKSIRDIAVLGIPPGENEPGKITKIWITLNPKYIGTVSPKEFGEWLEKNRPEYKLKTEVIFIEPESKKVLGKIQKTPIKTGKLQSAKKYL